MTQRTTCAGCPSLVKDLMGNAALFWGCGKTNEVVPHHTQRDEEKDEWVTRFSRVPVSCPLPADEVLKGEDPVPNSDQIIVRTRYTED